MQYLGGLWLAYVLINSVLDVTYWWQYLNATPEQSQEYFRETGLKRSCEAELVPVPPHFSPNGGSREEQIARWQQQNAEYTARHCARYEQYKASMSESEKGLLFIWNISHGLILLVLTIVGYIAYQRYKSPNAPAARPKSGETTDQALNDLMMHYRKDDDKK
jgi:hypothetical protein